MTENKFKEEQLNDEQLDKVAGGGAGAGGSAGDGHRKKGM